MYKRSEKNKFDKVSRDLFVTISVMFIAWFISSLLLPNTGVENNSALIFVSAIVLISSVTDGFFYGIAASIASTICINWFFMKPYGNFNLSLSGYPVAMISTLAVAIVVCTLTARIKKHARDAEEREKKTRELYRQNARLEKEKTAMEINTARAEIRSNILMSVSHDLRTPLTAISGAASIILSQNTAEHFDENTELVCDIKDQAEWMSIMVENIISVARLGGDLRSELQLKPEVPDEIIESCVTKLHRLFPGAEVILRLSEEVVLVYAEPILIRQVLQNLLENAVRHSGSILPCEIITCITDEGYRFTVRDRGCGLPRDIFDMINEDTILMDNLSGRNQSQGIGISACQSILKAHGSKLSAADVEGGGSDLSFTLRIVDME